MTNESTLDFWQTEAMRFESTVHIIITRTFALIGVVLTAMATVIVGLFVTKRVEVVLLIPFILLLVLPLLLVTVQEVLFKALYQYRAELMIVRELRSRDGGDYLPWEEVGGRVGNETRTTLAFWLTIAFLILFLGGASVAYFLVQGGWSKLFPITESNIVLTSFVLLGVACSATIIIVVSVVLVKMMQNYNRVKGALGYDTRLSTLEATVTRVVLPAEPALVAHAEAAIDGDDGARDVSGVV